MQEDFHYYATYCAAVLAGFPHEEALEICWSAQFTDCCSRTLLSSLKAPRAAATTQLQSELANARLDLPGLQDITRIWASFHFLPCDLYADPERGGKLYRQKYRLICGPNSPLLVKTIELARGRGLQAAGLAMHVLCDTWAHRWFAGTPSLVINNTDYDFYEMLPDGSSRPVVFQHNPALPDDLDAGKYTNTVYTAAEHSIMSLGHGRAGHLPDYSFIRYRYVPAWGGYRELVKDNPSDYMDAFTQMLYALRCLKSGEPFRTDIYDMVSAAPYEQEIRSILTQRRPDACAAWKAFGEKLSGSEIPRFDPAGYHAEYRAASDDEKDETFLGRFFLAALAQKSMVTAQIFQSGSLLAGYAVDYTRSGFRGIRDYIRLLKRKEDGR